MFNNMKNKIREKTGSDLPKFSLGQIQQKLGRHSRQGSETSLSSVALDEDGPPPIPSPPSSVPEDPPPSLQPDNNELTLADGKSLTPKDLARLAKREDEWRSRMEKRDAEWTKKLQKREGELSKLLDDKEREWRKQEQILTEDLLRLTRELKDALKVTEEYKRKLVQYQEDKDQFEGFQTQELAKIKHLLLAKEQENADNIAALKEANTLVDSMKSEVNRLRPFEEQVSNFQSSTKSENVDLAVRAMDAEKRCLEIQSENEKLLEELNTEREKAKETLEESNESHSDLMVEIGVLKEQLACENRKTESLEETLQTIQKEKDEAQLRNAQISQDMQLTRQQLRTQQQESDELYKSMNGQLDEKIKELENAKAEITKEKENQISAANEQELQSKINDLEVQLSDKNKMVRVLQQRLNDLKKTLQRELKASDPGGGNGSVLVSSSGNSGNGGNNSSNGGGNNNGGDNGNGGIEINYNNMPLRNSNTPLDDEVNFKYLKHVLIKFLTSREYEAQHLTRAVATLLKFSPEEERLLRDTLDWKMSWFGSRPRLPKNKTIPDS